MKKLVTMVLVSSMLLSISCDDKEKTKSKEELLTGGSSKSWNIVFDSSDESEDDPSCTVSATKNTDNQWIFNVDGSFRFNNGTITEVEDCEDCCSDIIDLIGYWELLDNGGRLKITATASVEEDNVNVPFDDEEVLGNSKLVKLTESEMVVEEDGATFKFNPN
jgi:hypothetical protein